MTTASADPRTLAGKHLTFKLGQERYGLEIMRVQEIISLAPVTRVPRLPAYVAGVLNLRGRVIPVVDLRLAFGFAAAAPTEHTCVIVVRVEKADGSPTVTGLIVDEVNDVTDLAGEQIEAVPEFGGAVDVSFLRAVGRSGEGVILLLDIDRVLSPEQVAALAEIA